MFHIHHIDGNRSNNELSNLMCVSPMEHFLIHLEKEEYMSAFAIYIKYLSGEEKNGYEYLPKIAAKTRNNSNVGFNNPKTYEKVFNSQKERIKNGTFHLQDGSIQRESNKKRVELGIHNFQSKENKERIKSRNDEMLKNKTHPFLKPKNRSDWAIKNKTCEFCNYVGRGVGFLYNHNEFCLENKSNKRQTCIVCGSCQHPSIIKRYHNEKCKNNKPSTTSRKT